MPQVEFEEDSRPAAPQASIPQRPSASQPRGMAGLLVRCGLVRTERAANGILVAAILVAVAVALWPAVRRLRSGSPRPLPALDTLYTRYGPPPLHPR